MKCHTNINSTVATYIFVHSCQLGMRKIFETSIMSSIDTSNLKHRCAKYIDQKISIFLNIDVSKKKRVINKNSEN
jgi:hypothetical protein